MNLLEQSQRRMKGQGTGWKSNADWKRQKAYLIISFPDLNSFKLSLKGCLKLTVKTFLHLTVIIRSRWDSTRKRGKISQLISTTAGHVFGGGWDLEQSSQLSFYLGFYFLICFALISFVKN